MTPEECAYLEIGPPNEPWLRLIGWHATLAVCAIPFAIAEVILWWLP